MNSPERDWHSAVKWLYSTILDASMADEAGYEAGFLLVIILFRLYC
jgi:hypothetical protein